MRKIILDTETAGLNPRDGVVEIAFIEVDDDLNTIASFHSLIDPEGPISPSASGIHGITAEMLADAPTLHQFFEMEGPADYPSDDLIIIGHNIDFDIRFLQGHLHGEISPVCTLRLARSLYPDVENHKLQTLRYTFGLDAGDAHSAFGDVVSCRSLVQHICGDFNTSLGELVAMCSRPMRVHFMPFGKHRGLPLDEVPKGYRKWLLDQDIDEDLRFSIECL